MYSLMNHTSLCHDCNILGIPRNAGSPPLVTPFDHDEECRDLEDGGEGCDDECVLGAHVLDPWCETTMEISER
jgi:hypothetical protein